MHDVEKTFFNQGYRIYHNSKHPSRGVGILVYKNIWEKGLKILGIDGDDEGNFLVIKAETTQGVFTLGSVYGPNHDEQANTYNITNTNTNTRGVQRSSVVSTLDC